MIKSEDKLSFLTWVSENIMSHSLVFLGLLLFNISVWSFGRAHPRAYFVTSWNINTVYIDWQNPLFKIMQDGHQVCKQK